MRISAKVDYAMRATLELAAVEDPPLKGEQIAAAQNIPLKFLENILIDLRHAGIVVSQRGPDGGYRLDHAPNAITVADVIRAVDGPLAAVRGERPEATEYNGAAERLQLVWIALRASLREVLEQVTLADLVEGTIPKSVTDLARSRDAWTRR